MASLKQKVFSAKENSVKNNIDKSNRVFITLSPKEQRQLSHMFQQSDFTKFSEFLKDKLFFDAKSLIKSNNDSYAFYSRLTCLYQEFHVFAKSYSELVQNQDTLAYQQKELLYFLIKQTKKLAFLSRQIVNLITEFKSLNPIKPTIDDRQY